jgi:hypothetical protein
MWVRWANRIRAHAQGAHMDLGKPMKRLQVGQREERVPAEPVQTPVPEPASEEADA